MVEASFSISRAWSIEPPCYIRKVDRSGHWADPATIQDKVFRPDPNDKTISVYVAHSAIDLVRVAIALNANRSSKTEPIFLVAMTGDEVNDLMIRQATGETLCRWANHLHHDFVVADPAQTARLVETLLAADRKPKKFTGKAMRQALDFTTSQGCYAANPDSSGCECEGELPNPGLFSRLGTLGRQLLNWLSHVFGKRNRW
jgi:hypothetical protein